jgi:hypothetical protein
MMEKFRCERCNPPHEWYPRTPNKPKVCPRCKSPYYDSARVKAPMVKRVVEAAGVEPK